MINHVMGNLLDSHKDGITHIGHQSNCKMGFGSGIAGQIRLNFAGAFHAFALDDRTPQDKFGSYSVGRSNVGPFQAIYNLYGQMDYGTEKVQTDLQMLHSAVVHMLNDIKAIEGAKIALPWNIGCGLAGGNWSEVYDMLEEVANSFGVCIHLYEYTP